METTSRVLYWHATAISGTILSAPTPLELAQLVSQTRGLMKPLPEWLSKGCIVGIVGGQKFVDEKYAFMKSLGLPMVGLWMQDWVG